jgi:hypothetical protein
MQIIKIRSIISKSNPAGQSKNFTQNSPAILRFCPFFRFITGNKKFLL